MNKHFLIENLQFKSSINKDDFSDVTYSQEKGYWISSETLQPLVMSNDRRLPSTKKADVERGEDLK